MKKVFQTIIDKDHGNCMQAAFASLFEVELSEVPNFIELKDNWFRELYKFITDRRYDWEGQIHNKLYQSLWNTQKDCFEIPKWRRSQIMTPRSLYKEPGVHGYFYAGVLSPANFNLIDGRNYTHAVIIDRDYKIVHDPNPNYQHLIGYPLAKLIKYNGIIDVALINQKK